ncbi:MAG: hypothetical protein JOZ25_01050 [Actinobacteria bacterium]|nr:hypothetical protein [Actinomycetota bacterium]
MNLRRAAGAGVAAIAVAALAAAAPASADCLGDMPSVSPVNPKPGGQPLEFGIYPGGSAGQLVVSAPAKPDDPTKILAALAELRPAGAPFTVHLYRSYLSDASDAQEEVDQRKLVAFYTGHGYGVEVVLRYRRNDDASGFARFVRGVVDRFGSNPLVRGFQVTNEVNFTASGDSSDGAYSGARDALIQGVIAAKDEARLRGYSQLRIGFNWFYRTDPNDEDSFWTYLHDHGGTAFAQSVDWVGLDVYPGTFFPPSSAPSMTGDWVVNALSQLHGCFLHEGGLSKSTPIHVDENGYPTGPGRSEADQQTALESMVGAVNRYRANYGVTSYFWFDLRDADSSSPNFQQQYGLMHDDYSPKPAFGSLRTLVDQLSIRQPPPPSVTPVPHRHGVVLLEVRCWRHGVVADLGGQGVSEVRGARITSRGRRVGDTQPPFRKRIRLDPTRHRRPRWVHALARTREGDLRLARSARCRIYP